MGHGAVWTILIAPSRNNLTYLIKWYHDVFDWRSAEWTVDLWELSVITFTFTSSHHLPSSSRTLVMNYITVSLFICLLVYYYCADVRSALERHVLDCCYVLNRGTKWSCGGISGTKFIHTQIKEQGTLGFKKFWHPQSPCFNHLTSDSTWSDNEF